MSRFLSVFLALACLLAAAACLPQYVTPPWNASDLRWLGPADAPTPATDLLAIYTRTAALSVDIRLDLLDINPGDVYRYKVSLWDNRYFASQPLQVEIYSSGSVRTSGTGGDKPLIWPRVIQNYDLDTVTISLNRGLIGSRYRVDVATYLPDSASPADQVLGVRSDGLPPVQRAALLVAFWNAFPADTPAQALRRWDGAHTGPLGDRHGLKHILDAAGRYRVPVTLLDLKTPASLAALDSVGALAQLDDLVERGLVLLPDAAYSQPAETALAFSRQAAAGFGLPDSRFSYSPVQEPLAGYAAQFVSLPDGAHLASDGGSRLVPLPAGQAIEATADGPDLSVRQSLIAAALSPDPADLVVLGGSLPESTWGDADVAGPTFAWLVAHPWVQLLDAEGLLAFPLGGRVSLPAASAPGPSGLLQALQAAPQNALGKSAWLTYLSLVAPTADPQLHALRQDYLGQVGELLAAARWADAPADRADCSQDLNGDGQPECVLADRSYFAVLDPAGCRLTELVYRDAAGPHQLVAPSSQFAIGLSDPSEWQPGRGEAADPSVIPGGFLDNDSWDRLSAAAAGGQVVFRAGAGGFTKTFRLSAAGLQVSYQDAPDVNTRLPLVVDPQAYYAGPTSYRSALTQHSWTWSLAGGISLRVGSQPIPLTAQGFISSIPFLSLPEDPNLDYPAGHYYPYPLSEVMLHGRGDFQVEIGVQSDK